MRQMTPDNPGIDSPSDCWRPTSMTDAREHQTDVPTGAALVRQDAGALTAVELLKASVEEDIWLQRQRSPHTRRAYKEDVLHFMRACDHQPRGAAPGRARRHHRLDTAHGRETGEAAHDPQAPGRALLAVQSSGGASRRG